MRPNGFACAAVALMLFGAVSADAGWSDDDLDTVLGLYVTEDGLVDYDSLADDRESLDRYIGALGRVSPDSHPGLFPTREQRLAYWMNAYNALMLHRVIEAWPIDSVKKIRPMFGVFWLEKHRLGERKWTLRGLENRVIRGRFNEPRIHFAINCASRGCPPLPQRAWRAATLDEDLEDATRRFVGDPLHVRFDPALRVVELSSIFKWFEGDFTVSGQGVLDYVRLYLPDDRRAAWGDPDRLELQWIPYDWSLNVAE